jgi:hypothetical protein
MALAHGSLVMASEKAAEPKKEAKEPTFDPTSHYAVKETEGWTVLVNKGFLAGNPGLYERVMEQLRHQLYAINRRLPAPAVAKLHKIKIWVELKEPHHPCMAYHPDAGWLRKHGMNPEKARCVELANAENFLSWTIAQPWMVLHELAHAYHHQFLGGFDSPEILAAYRKATEAKTYESVLHINGRKQRAYALTNQMEYFAEATEAYFGTNDFFPFVRAELQKHDPAMFELLGKLWEERGEKKQK